MSVSKGHCIVTQTFWLIAIQMKLYIYVFKTDIKNGRIVWVHIAVSVLNVVKTQLNSNKIVQSCEDTAKFK